MYSLDATAYTTTNDGDCVKYSADPNCSSSADGSINRKTVIHESHESAITCTSGCYGNAKS